MRCVGLVWASAPAPIVFLTVVTAGRRPVLASALVERILRETWLHSPPVAGWSVGRYVVMPDHVHLFARASTCARPMASWVKAWKSITSRDIAASLAMRAPIRQRDYFDRFLRSADVYSQKWDYVRDNPVRAGLFSGSSEWPWQGCLTDLSF